MRGFTGTDRMEKKTIAVLSGKGGTGKTFLSVNLACAAQPSLYIDCDAEEPNGHLFLKPDWENTREVKIPLPRVDPALCDGCRECVDFCAFHALAWAANRLLVFDELCHGCGGCMLVCPKQAISEENHVIGSVREGVSEGVRVLSGALTPGEASGIPIIKQLFQQAEGAAEPIVFIDCPPGSSCMVVESIRSADYCLLVTDPTRFGAHNLEMVHSLARMMNKPCGAVINKSMGEDDPSLTYCQNNDLPVLMRIPFDHELALLNSNAGIAFYEDERFQSMFLMLLETIQKEAARASAGHP